jgi:hypothetical protein
MQFAPLSEKELEAERQERMKLLAKGRGQFSVVNGTSKTGDDGSEYHLLTCDVWDTEGNQKQIQNVCLHPKALGFVRQFCYATGNGDLYESGNLTLDDCIGKQGDCEIDIEKGKPDGKGGMYLDKNKIKSFIVLNNRPASRPQGNADGISGAAAEQAGKEAYAAFKAKNPIDPVAQVNKWKASVAACFGGRDKSSIRADEWKRFVANGFAAQAPVSPISDDQQFKDDDIPF